VATDWRSLVSTVLFVFLLMRLLDRPGTRAKH
jgi:hypothetical protein